MPRTQIAVAGKLLPNLPPIPDVGELDTVADWKREVANLYRGMRRKQIDVRDGTAMAYVATVGANLAKIEEEIRQRDEISAALDCHAMSTNGHALAYSGFTDIDAPSQTETANPLIEREAV